MAEKKIIVKTLRTSEDFQELLSLSDLKTQMEVLGFLQKNLFDYQSKFFQSQLMTSKEFWDYLPDHDKPKYFQSKKYIYGKGVENGYYKEWSPGYALKEFTKYNKDIYILFDPKKQIFHKIEKKIIKEFTFGYKNGFLTVDWYRRHQWKEYARWAQCFMHDVEKTIEIKFDLSNNTLVSYTESWKTLSKVNCGSWYDSQNKQ